MLCELGIIPAALTILERSTSEMSVTVAGIIMDCTHHGMKGGGSGPAGISLLDLFLTFSARQRVT